MLLVSEILTLRFSTNPVWMLRNLAGLFVNRTEMQRLPLQADILSSEFTISITITRPRALTRLGLQISCEQLDWQLSSISQICDHLSSLLTSLEDLGIDMTGPSSAPEDMDGERWL
jgi:hypothetical protein